uniref:Transmembrane protein n=1 Tax=Globodera rostochiensis TaxID=31243 RepID=A0A914IC15_GLORO
MLLLNFPTCLIGFVVIFALSVPTNADKNLMDELRDLDVFQLKSGVFACPLPVCCGDLNASCCVRLQDWAVAVIALLIVLILIGALHRKRQNGGAALVVVTTSASSSLLEGLWGVAIMPFLVSHCLHDGFCPFVAVVSSVRLLLIPCRPSVTVARLSIDAFELAAVVDQNWAVHIVHRADFVKRRSVPAEHLALPHLLFCNRFPFTQAGLASLGAQFNRDFVLAYLRQWLDPSVGFGLPADDDAAMAGGIAQLSADDRTTAEATIAQLLPNGRLKQRLEQLMPQCQDMVSSCVLRGHQLSGFDCCRMVQPWLATPRAGICWPFVANASVAVQSPLDNARGIQITFQISRNSFQSGGGGGGAMSLHPGFSVHLVPADLHSRLRVSTSIESAFAQSLNDKRSLRLDIRKEIVADVVVSSPFSNGVCLDSDGGGADSVQHQQKGAQIVDIASAGLLCLLEKAVEQCACVPMIVVLWTLQGDLDSTFLRRFNASTICTVGEFDHCVHPFVEFAMAPAWDRYPTPSGAGPELKAAVDTCRKAFPRVCARAQFPARSQQRDLPPDAREMDLYKLFSTFGYNLWWFAIGHLLWTLCRFRFCHSSAASQPPSGKGNKVNPKSPMVPTALAAAAATTNSTTTTAPNPTTSDSHQQNNNNNANANANAVVAGGGVLSPAEQPSLFHRPTSAAHPLSPPPRPLPRGGARQLPPLTIASSSSGGGGTLGGSAIMEDGGREGPNNASSPPVDDEPPQRRRRGPKLALDDTPQFYLRNGTDCSGFSSKYQQKISPFSTSSIVVHSLFPPNSMLFLRFCPFCVHGQNELPTTKEPTEMPSDESAEYAELVEWTADELALKEKAIADNSWSPVYRYGGFVGVWFMLRLNLVFCALSFLSLPMSMSEQWPIAPSIGLILLSLVVCAGVKKYFTRIVAVVSVDSASRSIYRIGYPNFFAARRNRFVRVVDVVPLSASSENVRGIARLSFYDGPKDDFLLLPTVNVQILDKKAAFLLFGSTIKHFDADLPQSPAGPQRKKNAEKMLRIAMEEERKAQQKIRDQ